MPLNTEADVFGILASRLIDLRLTQNRLPPRTSAYHSCYLVRMRLRFFSMVASPMPLTTIKASADEKTPCCLRY